MFTSNFKVLFDQIVELKINTDSFGDTLLKYQLNCLQTMLVDRTYNFLPKLFVNYTDYM